MPSCPRALARAVTVCSAYASAAAALALGPAGCVAVPPEVRAEYTDDDGVRPNHYRVRPEGERAAEERRVFERAVRAVPDPATTTGVPRGAGASKGG